MAVRNSSAVYTYFWQFFLTLIKVRHTLDTSPPLHTYEAHHSMSEIAGSFSLMGVGHEYSIWMEQQAQSLMPVERRRYKFKFCTTKQNSQTSQFQDSLARSIWTYDGNLFCKLNSKFQYKFYKICYNIHVYSV